MASEIRLLVSMEERMKKDGRILTLFTLVNLGILGVLLFHRTQIVEANGA
jgi:hypothetical protein